MQRREVNFTIASGVKGVGKTYTTIFRIAVPYSLGILNNGEPRKVLIVDVNDEYGRIDPNPNDDFAMKLTGGKPLVIKAIEPKDIKLFSLQKKIEIRRLRPYHYRNYYNEKGKLERRAGEMMGEKELLKLVTKALMDFRGGLLIIEDLSTTVGTHVPQKVFSEITRNRHRDNDIITHVQSIGVVLPKFWQNINYTRFHKQLDDVDKSAEKLKGLYEIYKITQLMVDAEYENGNERFYLYIDNMKRKIRGQYSKEMILEAIYRYIDFSPNILRPLLNERTEGGRRLRTYSEARQEKAEELFNMYSVVF
jgi:hypothetical protein